MHQFGELWRDHADRMRENWDRIVGQDDVVLLAGDLSWGKDLDEAAPDLAWIGERPGRKVLLRGNHDSWWGGLAKVRRVLPPSCELLQHDALPLVDEWVLVGARGWTAPGDPYEGPGDEKVFRRELERLRMSLDDANRRFGRERPRLAMLHFPPWLADREPSDVVPLLRKGGVRVCVYGHLHGDDHRLAVTGLRDEIRYHFVAVDAVDFRPVEIELP